MRNNIFHSLSITLLIAGVVLFAGLLSVPVVFAQDSSAPTSRAVELKQNISSHQDEIKKLEEEIQQYQNRLVEVGNQKKSLQNEVKTIDLTRSKLASDAKLTQVRILATNEKIKKLSGSIDLNQERIEKNISLVGDIIHRIDQHDSDTLAEVILGNASLSDFLQEVNDMERLQSSIRDSIASLNRLKEDLGVQKSSFQAQQKDLLSLNTQLTDQKKLADQKRREQDQLLKETKNQESSYKKLLADKLARKKQFEKEIDNFEAQLRAEIDPTSFPKAGTKVLAYPVDDAYVTQRFGRTVDSVRLYAAGTHNGIDFRATPGTPLKAAGDGVVVGTGDTDVVCRGASYGRWVMIKHKNGLSTMYAHLELIKVSSGQNVSVGQIIGYSGTTGYATGPHLHFGLFVTSVTQIVNLPSKSCPGAIFRIPVSPANGYLDPQVYL
jgi:murein DD-endopeptidase MepM/ murein hydrolase activator NlpD